MKRRAGLLEDPYARGLESEPPEFRQDNIGGADKDGDSFHDKLLAQIPIEEHTEQHNAQQ